MDEIFRVYFDPAEIGSDGYPYAWHGRQPQRLGDGIAYENVTPEHRREPYPGAIKDLVRKRDGHRCLRCHHPYNKGDGEWSACAPECTHRGPVRLRGLDREVDEWAHFNLDVLAIQNAGEAIFDEGPNGPMRRYEIEAQWRILTVHHLNGIKHDCRWWNLVSLCQRCHLRIQRLVIMERHYHGEHSEWFKPFAAGFYASAYLGEELSMEETLERLDELLAIEQRTDRIFPVE